mgnify:CR=1 FL=1
MKKRVLSALLAAALTLSLVTPALAVTSQDDAAQVLAALDIMTGDESGNLNLSAPVTRAEFVKMLMAASPISVGDVTYVSPYPDVPASHWAAPYVEAAVTAGYVTGYLDGTFRPPVPKPEEETTPLPPEPTLDAEPLSPLPDGGVICDPPAKPEEEYAKRAADAALFVVSAQV